MGSQRSFYLAMVLLAVAQLPLVVADLPEVDCVMPAPGPWGACDAHGVQKRSQVVPRCFCHQSSTGASPGRGGNEEPEAVHCGGVQHSRQCAGSLPTESCRLGQWGSWGACARGFRDRKRSVPRCMCQSFECCPPDPTNGDGWECHDRAAQPCFVEVEQLASNEKVSCKHVQVTSPTAQSQALAGVFSFDWREMCDDKAVWVRPAKGSAPRLFMYWSYGPEGAGSAAWVIGTQACEESSGANIPGSILALASGYGPGAAGPDRVPAGGWNSLESSTKEQKWLKAHDAETDLHVVDGKLGVACSPHAARARAPVKTQTTTFQW